MIKPVTIDGLTFYSVEYKDYITECLRSGDVIDRPIPNRQVDFSTLPPDIEWVSFYSAYIANCTNEIKLTSPPLNKSPKFFIGGSVMTKDMVREFLAKDSEILLENMEVNEQDLMIRTRHGACRLFPAGSALVDPKTGKILLEACK